MNNTPASNPATERSFETLESSDLRRLSKLAVGDLADLFERRPVTGGLYRERLLMLCLCQGGAEHFVRQEHGVKDLDVWAFFAEHPTRPFPYRRRGTLDFGLSRFGRHPDDRDFLGRRIDIIGRSVLCTSGNAPEECVRRWLQSGETKSARLIAQRPVVAIYPDGDLGTVIWDPVGEKRKPE